MNYSNFFEPLKYTSITVTHRICNMQTMLPKKKHAYDKLFYVY